MVCGCGEVVSLLFVRRHLAISSLNRYIRASKLELAKEGSNGIHVVSQPCKSIYAVERQ